MISVYDDFQYAKESISIGVANYFLKGDMDREELLETLRSLKSRYAREEGKAQAERTHTIKELYLSPESVLEDLAGVPENGGAHLLYYTAENANTQMLDAMVSDFFFRNKTDCWSRRRAAGFCMFPGMRRRRSASSPGCLRDMWRKRLFWQAPEALTGIRI